MVGLPSAIQATYRAGPTSDRWSARAAARNCPVTVRVALTIRSSGRVVGIRVKL
jgi:hypothetical protein